jgi:hypothetical protein
MPLTSLAGSGEKLDMDSWISQPTCCELCREPFFSRAVGSVQICRCLAKGCHVRGPPAGSVRVVLVEFSPIGCISIRITATLGYK